MPPSSADVTLPAAHEMHTSEGRTLLAATPKNSCERSVTATTALPNVSGSWGITSRRNAAANAWADGNPPNGRWNDGPLKPGWAVTATATIPPPRIASASPYHRRLAAHTTPTNAAAASANGQGEGGVPRNTAGGSWTSFTEVHTSNTPTPSCNARTTGFVNSRASQSATPRIERRTRNAAISSPAAWITPGASCSATATAVSAFRGWTGNGTRKKR